jgi:lysophospholipase L1-like esterase
MKSGKVGSSKPEVGRRKCQDGSGNLKAIRLKYFLLLTVVCVLLTIPLHAQQRLQEKYPFLKTEKNRIDFYGDSTKFNTFFKRLDKVLLAGEGQVNVLHMGGSHVQGGTFSHSMRTYLQSIAPGLKGQRGLLFPFTLANTNNPWNYKVEKTGDWEGARVSVSHHFSEWGISGVSATVTNPASTATIYARDLQDAFSFDAVRIFYHMCECSYQPVVMNGTIVRSKVDSLKQFIEFTFSSPQDTLRLGLAQVDSIQSQFTLQGIQFLSSGPAIVYNPIGVNGAKTSDYLRSQSFSEQVKLIAPDVVLFGIGINDANTYAKSFDQAKYEENYDALIAVLKEANPDVSVLFLTNNDAYFQNQYPNPNAYKVRDAMINLAKRHDGAVWDFFEIMGGFDSIRIWEAYDLARPDKIHFSREGYELQAQLLFYALRTAYGDYLSATFRKNAGR